MSTVRVLARVGVDHMRAGRWYDLPDDDHLADLLDLGFVTRTGLRGELPPGVIPSFGCCGY